MILQRVAFLFCLFLSPFLSPALYLKQFISITSVFMSVSFYRRLKRNNYT